MYIDHTSTMSKLLFFLFFFLNDINIRNLEISLNFGVAVYILRSIFYKIWRKYKMVKENPGPFMEWMRIKAITTANDTYRE